MPSVHKPVTDETEAPVVPAEGGATQSDDEMFDDAWDEAGSDDGEGEPVDNGDGDVSTDNDGGQPETGSDEGGEGDGEAGAEDPAEEDPQEPGAEDAGAEAGPSDDALKAQVDRLEALLAKEQSGEGEAEPAADEPPAAQPIYSAEEQEKVDEFKSEWPDVAEGIELLMKDYRQQIMQEMSQKIEPMVSPAVQFAQQTQADQHIQQLEAAHPDYGTIYEDIVSWVDQQPAYLKNAYTEVAQNGATQDVIDLISRFKAETGTATQTENPQPKPKPKAEGRNRTLPDEAKQAAQSLGVVNSQRSAEAKAEDPNDFEGGWADALRES